MSKESKDKGYKVISHFNYLPHTGTLITTIVENSNGESVGISTNWAPGVCIEDNGKTIKSESTNERKMAK